MGEPLQGSQVTQWTWRVWVSYDWSFSQRRRFGNEAPNVPTLGFGFFWSSKKRWSESAKIRLKLKQLVAKAASVCWMKSLTYSTPLRGDLRMQEAPEAVVFRERRFIKSLPRSSNPLVYFRRSLSSWLSREKLEPSLASASPTPNLLKTWKYIDQKTGPRPDIKSC